MQPSGGLPVTDDADAIDRLFQQSPPTIGPTEVAQRLGVSQKSVYTWLKDGLIPGYKLGTNWLIITDELKNVLRAGANKHTPTGPVIVVKPTIVEGE
jgi:excisionase family DNA binding protein